MKYYFSLLGRILKRNMNAWGLSWFTAGILVLVFCALMYAASRRFPQYAEYGFMYLGLSFLFMLQGAERIGFLKILFPVKRQFITVRILENFAVLLLLLIVSVCFFYFFAAIVLICGIFIFAYFDRSIRWKKSLPTPFRRYPFEFIILFRRFWFVYLFLYAIAIIAVVVHNFNLLAVVVALLGFLGWQAYAEVEPEEMLWNYSMSTTAFLQHKIKRAVAQQSLMLVAPLLAGVVVFPDYRVWLLLIGVIVSAVLILIVFMKYSVFPEHAGIILQLQVLIATCLPFLLIGLIPYYYRKAHRNLTFRDYDSTRKIA